MIEAASLKVEGLSITTPAGLKLIDDVSFEVSNRELILLIGPSGSGKTSIVNALCGLLDTSDGEWQVAGRLSYVGHDVDLATTRSDLCGLVFQDNALFDDLSVEENLRIAADHAPVAAKAGDNDSILSLLSDVEPSQAIAACSGGQKQRVAIARTLIAGRPVLVLDEPNSGLDIKSSRRLAGLIKSICTERAIPVIIVAHHVDDLLPFADKVLLLDSRTRKVTQLEVNLKAIEQAMMQLDVGASLDLQDATDAPQKFRRLGTRFPKLWFARYFIEYFWVLCLSPYMLAYVGVGGAILGFVSIWFGFNYHSFGGYLKSILHDETLAGIGYVQTTIAVPLVASILVVARNSAIISADLGNRIMSSQFRAMRNLDIPGLRYLTLSIIVANMLALLLLTAAALVTASWSAYQTWSIFFPDQPFEFWQENYFRRLLEAGQGEWGWGLAKVILSALLSSAAAIAIGLRRKTDVISVNNAIAKAIVIGVSLTLLAHAFLAVMRFRG